jgi:hypothetical protein
MWRTAIAVLFSTTLVLLCSLAVPSSAMAAPTKEDMAEARKHMDAGVRFMQDPAGPRWDEAYDAFKKAWKLSGSINALLNLAITAQKLELDGEAIDYYEKLLAEEKKLDWRDRKQIKNDLKVLTASVVHLKVKVNVPVRLIDVRTPRQGKPLRNVYNLEAGEHELGIHPGDHRFTATADGKVDQTWTTVLQNAAKVEHVFEMQDVPPPPPLPVMVKTVLVEKEAEAEESRPVPLYVLAPGLLTLAAGGVMGTFMVLSTLKADELEEARGVKTVEEQRELRDELVTYNLVADIGIGVTAAGAVTTLVLILTRPTVAADGGDVTSEEPSSPDAKPPASKKKQAMRFGIDWLVAPSATPAGGGATFVTRF